MQEFAVEGIRISIVIPVYNNPLIDRALQSVKKHINRANTEVIVVDGDSSDRTKEIISAYRDLTDVVISEKDNGPYDAANKGIKAAKGDWILWLAADDELLLDPNNLLYDATEENTDVICGSVLAEKADGSYEAVPSNPDLKRLYYHCSLRQPATLFRRQILLENNLYNTGYKYAADRELFLRLYTQNARFAFRNENVVLFHYGGLTTSTKVIESYREDLKISEEYGANKIMAKGLYAARIMHFSMKNRIRHRAK